MWAAMAARKIANRFVKLVVLALGVLTLGGFCHPALGLAGEFDASLGVMAYDREVSVTINGIHLDMITGGKYEGARLFLKDSPQIKEMAPEEAAILKSLFCLREGENSIEISFKAANEEELTDRLTITVDSGNYQVPVLEYIQGPEVREGRAIGTFSIYTEPPAGFSTTVLK
jgi:hypothetical protein